MCNIFIIMKGNYENKKVYIYIYIVLIVLIMLIENVNELKYVFFNFF